MSSAGSAIFNAASTTINLGGAIGNIQGAFPGNTGQSFQTIPLSNQRLALYSLVIRSPTPPNAAYLTYIFPLSPASVRKETTSMTNIYDVAGPLNGASVQRIADLYGESPYSFTLEGTTGWQSHATDNFKYTGIQSVLALQDTLLQFANLNKQQQDNGNGGQLYIMEFYDYFMQDYWQVVPVGKQVFSQTQARPLIVDYSIQLAGIQSLTQPLASVTDTLLSGLLAASSNQQAIAMTTAITAALFAYSNTVLGFLPETNTSIGVL